MRSIRMVVAAVLLTGCASQQITQPAPSPTRTETCHPVTEPEIAALFDRWNNSLQSGDPRKVAANYAGHSILLPTLSNEPRLTPEKREDYFHHFLADQPSGKIDFRHIDLSCNVATDSGLYTFSFAKTGAVASGRYSFTYEWDGSDWLITSHHSSMMPEKVSKVGAAKVTAKAH